MDRTLTFLDRLAEVLQDEITVGKSRADLVIEARANQWSFSLTPAQVPLVQPRQVVAFITTIMEAREATILAQDGIHQCMIFYCWFDEQAVQLRLSLVSAQYDSLPFGCHICPSPDLLRVVERFLQSPHHGGIWEDERMSGNAHPPGHLEEPQDTGGVLEVWSVQIPRPSTDRERGRARP